MRYAMYNPTSRDITGDDFECVDGYDLTDARRKVGNNLVEKLNMPTSVFLSSEIDAGEMRSELMKGKLSDLVVTVVIKLPNTIRVESVYQTELTDRINELKRLSTGQTIITLAYSEETGQIFYKDDVSTCITPRLPNYDYQPVKKIRRKMV